MTKFVFVTGGVVSSLGKGIAAASLAAILESRGLKVTMLKLDPYINVDPGTMSPMQHGEVFVTDDGAETDLDLGHYERFISTRMKKGEQLHHRPDLRIGDPQGTPRRVPRQDGAGDPAHHQRDPGLHLPRRRRRGRGAGRNRRHRGRHRIAAVPRSGAPAVAARRPQVVRLRAPDPGAVHRLGRRTENQAYPAQRAEAARDRHLAERAAVPRRPPDPGRRARQDLAVLERRRAGRHLGVGRRHHLQGAAGAARPGPRRDHPRSARHRSAAGRPVGVDQADPRAGKPEGIASRSAWSASTST